MATPDDTPSFDPSLISPDMPSLLPKDYTLRPLQRSDFHAGFLTVLSVLTTVGDISEEAFLERYDYMAARNDTYFIIVVCDGSGKIVGTGALVCERKFIRGLAVVGHIEDIAVGQEQQGMKLGLRIIQALDGVAQSVGCYKVSAAYSFLCRVFGFYARCCRASLWNSHTSYGWSVDGGLASMCAYVCWMTDETSVCLLSSSFITEVKSKRGHAVTSFCPPIRHPPPRCHLRKSPTHSPHPSKENKTHITYHSFSFSSTIVHS